MGMILKRSALQLKKQTNSFLLGNSDSVDTFNFTLELCCSNLAKYLHSGKSNCDYYQVSLIMTIMPCRFISFACDDKKWKS